MTELLWGEKLAWAIREEQIKLSLIVTDEDRPLSERARSFWAFMHLQSFRESLIQNERNIKINPSPDSVDITMQTISE